MEYVSITAMKITVYSN